jgi:hypothetical protein
MSSSAPVESNPETPSPRGIEICPDRMLQARRLSSAARRATIAVASCIALAIVVSPARAGFFDFLFPSAQPAMPAYRPPPHFFHRRIAHVEHHQKKIVAAPRHRIVEAKAHPVAPGAVDLMDDDSLRDGDAVMTPTGLRIFVGSEGRHHSQGDFARISDTEGLSRRARSALLAVDAGHAGEAPAPVTGRSATDTGISAGVPIVDPRGQKIRYVGP